MTTPVIDEPTTPGSGRWRHEASASPYGFDQADFSILDRDLELG